jgi:hypothetical protein
VIYNKNYNKKKNGLYYYCHFVLVKILEYLDSDYDEQNWKKKKKKKKEKKEKKEKKKTSKNLCFYHERAGQE